jgi:carbon monoxide dehydrogenase subunit G
MLKRIAITLFLVITVAIIAVLSIAATRPATFHVERSLSISAPAEAVFAVVNDMRRFHEWSPWQKLDPAMKITYEGPSSGVGASYSWVGNKDVGEGRMTITDATPPGSITQKLEFLKPFESTCAVRFTITPDGQGSRVTWGIDGNNNYMSKVMGLFVSMDSMMGKDFESGLTNLRQVAEAAPAPEPAATSPAAAEKASTKAAPSKP